MEDFNTYNRAWIKRALNPNTPTTVAKETVRTSSTEYNGKEILFPTIRLVDGELKKFSRKDAFRIAVQKKILFHLIHQKKQLLIQKVYLEW